MAVQLPTIQRMDVPAPAPQGRVDAEVPDATNAYSQIRGAYNNLGNEIINAVDKFEKDAIDTEVTRSVNEYDQWYRTKLHGDSETDTLGLVHSEGDPTEIFNTFDEEAIAKQEEIFASAKLSKKGKAILTNQLSNRHNSLYASRLTAYGNQYDRYKNGILNSAIRLEKQGAADSLQFLNPTDQTSAIPFESSLGRIRDLRLRDGIKNGTVNYDEKGGYQFVDEEGIVRRVSVNQSVKEAIATDVSESVYNSINNVIAGEDFSKAKFMLERYGDQVMPDKRDDLQKSFDQLFIKNKAHFALSQADGKTFTEQKRIVRDLTPKQLGVSDPAKAMEIKLEARKLIDTNERYIENEDKRHQDKVYNNAFHTVFNKMQSGEPYVNQYEMENDGRIKPILNFINPTQKKALYELVAGKPIASDPEVKKKMLGYIFSGEYFRMPPDKLMENLAGLSKEDSRTFENYWMKQNEDSDSRSERRLDNLNKNISDIFSNMSNDKVDGKLTKRGQENLDELKYHFVSIYQAIPWNLQPNEREAWLRKEIADFTARKKAEQTGWGRTLGTLESIPFIGDAVSKGIRSKIADPREEFKGRPPINLPPRTGGGVDRTIPQVIPSTTPAPKAPRAKFTPQQLMGIISEYEKATGRDAAKDGQAKVMEWYNGKQ